MEPGRRGGRASVEQDVDKNYEARRKKKDRNLSKINPGTER